MLCDPREYREKVFAWAEEVGLRQVRLVIHQPRVGGPTEDVVSMDDLEAFAKDLHHAAQRVRIADAMHSKEPFDEWWPVYLNPQPSTEDCAYCRAMAVCPSVKAKLERDLEVDFAAVAEGEPLPALGAMPDDPLNTAMLAVPLLEDRCKAIRAEVERRLLSGQDVADFGLELGRQGNRKWTDSAAAEKLMRETFRLKVEEAYNLELKSPTQIERLTKGAKEEDGTVIPPKLGLKRWKKLEGLVSRADAKPSVKLKSVIKVAWKPTPPQADEFTPVVEDDGGDLS